MVNVRCPRIAVVNPEKNHRYVSDRGPIISSFCDRAILQAIAVAENEGWPTIAAESVPPSSPRQRIPLRDASESGSR